MEKRLGNWGNAQTCQANLKLTIFSSICDSDLFSHIFSTYHQRFDKRVFSCFWKIAEIPEKSIKIIFMSFSVESVICPLAGTCMRDHLPTILLFLVTWVQKMTCWAKMQSFQPWHHKQKYWSLPFPGQWPPLKLAQQVIFSTHVTKNNRIVGKWSRIEVPANGHMTDSTWNDI